jgi:hypothetical protein
MGPLFERYFLLLAGRFPGAEYGVIATSDEAPDAIETATSVGLCPCC